MLQSHVVEVNGTFVGAGITTSTGFRFRAVHVQVEELDESTWHSLDELSRAVRHLFTTGRVSAIQVQAAVDPLLLAPASGVAAWME